MSKDAPSLPAGADRKGWKKVEVEFTGGPLSIAVPPDCRELTMGKVGVLPHPREEIERALNNPIGSSSLEEIIAAKGRPAGGLKAALTVSDITRPVPYKGKKGFLTPLLKKLLAAGIERQNILIIVGTGTHRASTPREKIEILGRNVVASYRVEDHNCEDAGSLGWAGKTPGGTDVHLNRRFLEADLRIATGLTETHFMAGASGGRKAICPGLVDLKTIQKFHSPEFLESEKAANLVLEGNPCHEEALAVARAAGVDFAVTATLDQKMRLTGIFAGDLERAFQEAVRRIKSYVEIPLEQEFDIVLTHGGYVGRNHYQTAKAAVGALPAVKPGGTIIIAADNRDPDPVGGPEYRSLLHLLKLQGPEGYVAALRNPSWKFTRDQWEPEVWGKVLKKVGEQGLIYCTTDIPERDFAMIPGRSAYGFLTPAGRRQTRSGRIQEMVQNAVLAVHRKYREQDPLACMAFICEGPYAVPVRKR